MLYYYPKTLGLERMLKRYDPFFSEIEKVRYKRFIGLKKKLAVVNIYVCSII